MDTHAIACLRCRGALPPAAVNTPAPVPCPACGAWTMTAVFPALFRRPASGAPGERLVAEDEAGCFYHPRKRAATVCELCGRFLCALCDVDFNGKHCCPACIEHGAQKGTLPSLDNYRMLYDSTALGLAVLPLFFCVFATAVTAPLSLYVALRYWKAPTSILGRTRVRMVLALALAGAQLVLWLIFVAWLLFRG